MINTIIIGSQKQVRQRIASLLSPDDDINVLAQGNDGYDALKLVGNFKPDIAILDNIDGEEIPHLLKLRSPATAVVIVVAKISDHQIYKAASNEVSGFVNKETDLDTLPTILKFISQGRCFISPVFASRVLQLLCSSGYKGATVHDFATNKAPSRAESTDVQALSGEDPTGYLSKTELRILVEIGEGHTSSEIAENLGLAVGTVRNCISAVMHKTGLINRSQMVRYAFGCGLVPINSKYSSRTKKV